MKQQYINLLKLKNQYYGIAQGFNVLDRILNNLESLNLNNNSSENIITIYDYRIDKYINIKSDTDKFELLIQKVYQEYLLKEYFVKFEWYNNMVSSVKKTVDFGPDNEIVIPILIKYIMRTFLHLANFKNKYSFKVIIKYLAEYLDGFPEPMQLTKKIVKKLIYDGLIKKTILFDTMSFTDQYFNDILVITSAGLTRLYSDKPEYQTIKYSCSYALEQLPLVIDYYNNYINFKFDLLTTKHNLKTINPELVQYIEDYTNPSDNIIQSLDTSDSVKLHFSLIQRRKQYLNEYCFHVIVMSFVSNYVYTPNSKHVLFYKNYSSYGLNF